jgi:hypothetical protein
VHNKKKIKPVSSNTTPLNRKERRKELQAEEPAVHEALHKHPVTLIAKKVFSSFLFWLIFSMAVGSLFLLAYPRVSVRPGSILNSGEPFQIPFVIKNDGYLSIHEVDYSLSLENIEFGQGNTLPQAYSGVNETHLPGLAPNRSSTISLTPFIDLLKQSFGIVLPPKAVTSAELAIDLSYRSYLIPYIFKDRVRFKTTISSTGEYAWSEYRGQK